MRRATAPDTISRGPATDRAMQSRSAGDGLSAPAGSPVVSGSRRDLPAILLALIAAAVLVFLIYIGSRHFQDFDAALIGYAVGSVFALAGLVYRYTLWITRPPTWRYFRAGWSNFLSWRNFKRYTILIPVAWWTDILAQTFIRERSTTRWAMHLSIFWGVVLSCAITFPLTFGWIHFTLASRGTYQAWFFGLPLVRFPLDSLASGLTFHALDITAAILLIGLGIAFWRRITDAGLAITQRFSFDLLPLVLLFAIAITGLALTASSTWWAGRYYWFISLTHQTVVVIWLLMLPFGKFFHIVERPATIGVTLYQTINQDVEQTEDAEHRARCARCGEALPSLQFLRDLRATLSDLDQRYDLGERWGNLQMYCPTCKRLLRGEAYYQLLGRRFL